MSPSQPSTETHSTAASRHPIISPLLAPQCRRTTVLEHEASQRVSTQQLLAESITPSIFNPNTSDDHVRSPANQWRRPAYARPGRMLRRWSPWWMLLQQLPCSTNSAKKPPPPQHRCNKNQLTYTCVQNYKVIERNPHITDPSPTFYPPPPPSYTRNLDTYIVYHLSILG